MPKVFGSQIDLEQAPPLNLVLEHLSSPPAAATNGRMYYDDTLKAAMIFENNAWQEIVNEGGGSGGGGAVEIQDENNRILSAASILDFQGAGVKVTKGIAGESIVTIPGDNSPRVFLNYAINPSVEVDTGYWGGASIARSTAQALFGASSLYVIPAGLKGGAFSSMATPGGRYSGNVWVFSPTADIFTLRTDLMPGIETTTSVPANKWTKLTSLTVDLPAGWVNWTIVCDLGKPFYTDGLMVVDGDFVPGYFDGDTADTALDTYEWTDAGTTITNLATNPSLEISPVPWGVQWFGGGGGAGNQRHCSGCCL
jgi:hypothetical protein